MQHCQIDQNLTILRYEDMVLRFDSWLDSFFDALDLNKAVRDTCYSELAGNFSRADEEHVDKHRNI